MTETTSNPECPMASMCKGMAGKSTTGFLMMIPGIILILLGMLVLFQPEILAWLVAIMLIIMGFGFLFMAKMMGKFGALDIDGNS